MGIFNQAKLAADVMKNMNPAQLKDFMQQARESQKILEEQIRRIVREEIEKYNLVGREAVEEMLKKFKNV